MSKFFKIKSEQIKPTTPKPTMQPAEGYQWSWNVNTLQWEQVPINSQYSYNITDNKNTVSTTNTNTTATYTTGYTTASLKDSDNIIACLSQFINVDDFNDGILFINGLEYKPSNQMYENGLVKYAGYDFMNGSMVKITPKGLDYIKNFELDNYNRLKKQIDCYKKTASEDVVVDVNGTLVDIKLVFGISNNQPQDWTQEIIKEISQNKDDSGYAIISFDDYKILRNIQKELSNNNKFSFELSDNWDINELYNKILNENKKVKSSIDDTTDVPSTIPGFDFPCEGIRPEDGAYDTDNKKFADFEKQAIKWYNIELEKDEAEKLKLFLKENKVKYEVSEVERNGKNIIHFEMQLRPELLEKVSSYIDNNIKISKKANKDEDIMSAKEMNHIIDILENKYYNEIYDAFENQNLDKKLKEILINEDLRVDDTTFGRIVEYFDVLFL